MRVFPPPRGHGHRTGILAGVSSHVASHTTPTAVTAGACAALLCTGLATSTAARAATEWDLPLAWPDGNFHVENVKTFVKVVGQVTGGEVTINVHPAAPSGSRGRRC